MIQRKNILNGITGAIPLACGMIAATCALPTAFEIGVHFPPLIAFCVIAALLLSFWMCIPKYGFGFGALFLAGVLLLVAFRLKQIGDGATVFFTESVKTITESVPEQPELVRLMENSAAVVDRERCVACFLMIVAAGLGVLTAFSLLRGNMIIMTILILLPPVLISFIFTNLQPASWVAVLFTAFIGYTVFGNGLRRGSSKRAGWFFAILAPVLLLVSLLIFAIMPSRENYVEIPEKTRQKIFSDVFGDISDKLLSRFGNGSPDEIDLDTVKNHDSDDEVTFSVRASQPGTYHLRVHSYGSYNGRKWLPADDYDGEWASMEALGNRQSYANDSLSVRAYGSTSNERAVPYAFLAEGVAAEESFIPRKGMWEYTWTFTRAYLIEPQEPTEAEQAYYRFARKQYTMPEGNERDALRSIAGEKGILPLADPGADAALTYDTARRVAELVRSGREYTPTPPDVPRGEDFILYFLLEGKQGYCVHFASATTAILQALGIPSRYTIGYYVPEMTGTWQGVPENAKHAWAEVYLLGVGWVPIESTPYFRDSAPKIIPAVQETGSVPNSSASYGTAEPLPIPSFAPDPGAAGVPLSTPGPGGEPAGVPGTEAPSRTEAPESNATPAPAAERNADRKRAEAKQASRAWWLLLLLIPILWFGAGMLIRTRREKLFRDPNVRRSIPEMAHYLGRIERFGIERDPDAGRWALEAAFSAHAMTEEHRTLLKRVRAAQKTIRKRKPVLWLLLRWVLFVA